jgi:hypothetical protein
MYQNQPDPAVIAAERNTKMVVQEAKKKNWTTRWLPEATVAVATTGDAV